MAPRQRRSEANDRERRRTAKLNSAYKRLQSIIPKEPFDKMSKINTLKLAQAYIDFLNKILNEQEPLPVLETRSPADAFKEFRSAKEKHNQMYSDDCSSWEGQSSKEMST